MTRFALLLLVCRPSALVVATSSGVNATTSSGANATTSDESDDDLEAWEIALASGVGALACILFGISLAACVLRNRRARSAQPEPVPHGGAVAPAVRDPAPLQLEQAAEPPAQPSTLLRRVSDLIIIGDTRVAHNILIRVHGRPVQKTITLKRSWGTPPLECATGFFVVPSDEHVRRQLATEVREGWDGKITACLNRWLEEKAAAHAQRRALSAPAA